MYQKQSNNQQLEKRVCYFCRLNIKYIDYKNSDFLKSFVSMQAKIRPQRRTACCAKHQRALALAVKRARYMALLPYTI